MVTSMEAAMFIMFNMHVHMCMHSWGHPHTPTPTHLTHSLGGDPPNQLKCYDTWTNQDASILFEDLKSV